MKHLSLKFPGGNIPSDFHGQNFFVLKKKKTEELFQHLDIWGELLIGQTKNNKTKQLETNLFLSLLKFFNSNKQEA